MIIQDNIKIQNLYYVFLYAWEKFSEGRSLKLEMDESPDLPNLMTNVLLKSVKRIIKKGLHKDYKPKLINEQFIKGKIDFKKSIQNNFQISNKLYWRFSELSVDSILNKIIKRSFLNLLRNQKLKKHLKEEINSVLKFFTDVETKENLNSYFSKFQLSQNNNYYRLPIEICKMLDKLKMPNQKQGDYIFTDILDDEVRMSDIFERFVGNFYKYEQTEFKVKTSEQLDWQFQSLGGDLKLVPKQRTDITLSNKDKVIIIDTKYYKKPLVDSFYGQDKFKSDHLRQITTYILNMEDELNDNKEIEGILLYADAEGSKNLNEDYRWRKYNISLKSINLNQDWQNIHIDLLSILSH